MQASRPARKSLLATLGIVLSAQAVLMVCMVATAALLTPAAPAAVEQVAAEDAEHSHSPACQTATDGGKVSDFRGLVLF